MPVMKYAPTLTARNKADKRQCRTEQNFKDGINSYEYTLYMQRYLKDHPGIDTLDQEQVSSIPACPSVKWYVVGIDEGILETFQSLPEAKEYCRFTCDDGRKRAGFTKNRVGSFWEYSHANRAQNHLRTLFIGTKEALIQQGFDWALDEESING